MRSRELSLEQYDSDKIVNRYLDRYDPMLVPWVGKDVCLLELGVHKGGSLLLWRDYFPRGTIVGIDIRLPKNFRPPDRIHLYEGSQADPEFLSRVAREVAPDGFDIIIDDASHVAELTKAAFWHLFENHLKSQGLYVIEDWGTGFWEDWPDGKRVGLESTAEAKRTSLWSRMVGTWRSKAAMRSHQYGMVGLVKQLVDEQGAADASRELQSGRPKRQSRFESMTIVPGIVFIRKT